MCFFLNVILNAGLFCLESLETESDALYVKMNFKH